MPRRYFIDNIIYLDKQENIFSHDHLDTFYMGDRLRDIDI